MCGHRANVDRLLSHNLTATYVPLGFGDCLAIGSAADAPPLSQRQIDVLFYGTVLPRRTRIIRNLRAAGIRVRRLLLHLCGASPAR